MDVSDTSDYKNWPPGTVRIEELQRAKGDDIILQPQPTDDPNDPLNWPLWRKHLNFGLSAFYVLMVFALIDISQASRQRPQSTADSH